MHKKANSYQFQSIKFQMNTGPTLSSDIVGNVFPILSEHLRLSYVNFELPVWVNNEGQ